MSLPAGRKGKSRAKEKSPQHKDADKSAPKKSDRGGKGDKSQTDRHAGLMPSEVDTTGETDTRK